MADFAARRLMMVDTQVRPSDVTRFPIIAAMLKTPREAFVPADLVEAAYMGENLPLAPGRVLLEPRTLAKMLDSLDLGGQDLVLDLAPGTGYSSAVIAQIAQAVVAVEPDPALAAEAEQLLAVHGAGNAVVEVLNPAEGAPAHGPYDAIIVQGGIAVWPEALTAQLKDGGRVSALFVDGKVGDGSGTVRLGVLRQGVIGWRDLFHTGAPVLMEFESVHDFAF